MCDPRGPLSSSTNFVSTTINSQLLVDVEDRERHANFPCCAHRNFSTDSFPPTFLDCAWEMILGFTTESQLVKSLHLQV
jgi:hypothetical protein